MNNLTDLRSLTRNELEAWIAGLGLPAYRGRQLFRWLWKPGINSFGQITEFSKEARSLLEQHGAIKTLAIAKRLVSEDGTKKLMFELDDKRFIESVIIPEKKHTTLCLSTQVGCAMGCAFCRTALMGFVRQLSPSEIAMQALRCIEEEGVDTNVRNIVFMGMGEPLANYDNFVKALRIVMDNLGLDFSSRRVTVSTCGLIPQMLRLGEEIDISLAISLHAPDDETRSRLMPINKKYPVDELLAACKTYRLAPRRRITFEYILISGVNDSLQQAKELVRKLHGIKAKVNLIPFNEGPELAFKCPDWQHILAFQKVLLDAGYTTIIRKSKGRDIMAACGQLAAKARQGA